MPGGIEITINKTAERLYFPVPHVTLPILKKDIALLMLPWGRRDEDDGLLPPGGWARLSSIKKGTWERYHAVPVKIPATGWMEKDEKGTSHYFPLNDDECLQGLVASIGIEKRVYIVTVAASETADIHPRAPRIIKSAKPQSLWRVDEVQCATNSDAARLETETTQRASAPLEPDSPVFATHSESTNIIPELPTWSAHLPLRQRALLHWLSTSGEVSGEAIQAEYFLRQLRSEDKHDKS